MVHCLIHYETQFACAWNTFRCRGEDTHYRRHSHHPAQLRDLIMPPFRSPSHSTEYARDGERRCLFFGAMLLLFFTSGAGCPNSDFDTCCANLLSFTGSAYMLSLQQMSSPGSCSLNRIFHQRQSQN